MRGTIQKPFLSRTYLIVYEVLNAVTHGVGFFLSVAGFVFLMLKVHSEQSNAFTTTAYAIYGSSLLILYLSSTLFHSLIFTRAKHIFQIFDHSSIFLLIAGSYTPYCLLAIHSTLGYWLCGIIWLLAILGVVQKAVSRGPGSSKASTVLYVLMGWGCLIAMRPLYQSLGPIGFTLLVAGGVAFTVGAVIYSFQQIKFIHVIWHVFVMLGTAFMYFSILFYI
ncbi:PAQR family membrane homeostasis protein TrhA [Loigolactobacillus bifermentans]|uniref:PAQR family membrane homeostasis protein TrhA n=1 Tax=Loigolactobacillus bifermentans TaxID=1607 RepID=UPI00070DF2B7|nr:hemolysin III family protein [Loigolactobacillus bifermentans]QGG59373.1 hemolysin III family protein [Loigolactobacillus bifermentans]